MSEGEMNQQDDTLICATLQATARVLKIRNKGDDEYIASMLQQAADALAAKGAELIAVQARLDAVMLEYCPDEMTKEQLADWQANQCVAGD